MRKVSKISVSGSYKTTDTLLPISDIHHFHLTLSSTIKRFDTDQNLINLKSRLKLAADWVRLTPYQNSVLFKFGGEEDTKRLKLFVCKIMREIVSFYALSTLIKSAPYIIFEN